MISYASYSSTICGLKIHIYIYGYGYTHCMWLKLHIFHDSVGKCSMHNRAQSRKHTVNV